ncbi:carcinoembryonic antigen-related cell adhesion molecule 8-like isoform X1 [Hyperolius riggenbachi]|uniref:carcinoembryonic antigen-related cell adhesion molecule 8-like isoform X1 n=1 Tax=Hyperolius riggenbachi TaxID=752182 RepID=UPI0035A328E2
MIYQQRWLCLRVISALLSVWMGVASGETLSIQLIPQHPVIRGSVTLRVTGVTGGDIRSINWYRGAGTLALNQILAYIPSVSDPVKLNGPMYHNRIEAFPNASLLISSLERTDEGDYTVQVQTDTAQQASVTLTVYELVGKPTITASPSVPNPKENDTVTLTCTAANAERLVWSRDGTSLPSSASLSSDNRTVTFSRITRMDSGSYQCNAENPATKESSAPYTLTVAYGPENVKLTNQSNGDTIRLKCSADSLPSPSFQWIYNENNINIQQDTITVQKGGNYTCLVYNSITQLNASASMYVYVPTSNAAEGATDSLSNGIGTAAIIGIVVAMVLLVALTAAIVLLLLTQRRRKKALESRNSTSMAKTSSRNGTANASTPAEAPELQYADINFRTNMGRQKQEQEQPELQYAEVNISKNMGKNKQEAPELQYADIDFSKNMGKKKQPSPDSPYANSGAPQQPPPDAVVYSELRRN